MTKNIVVTGAAQGIGRATARYLAQRGHRLFLVDVNEAALSYTAKTHLPHAIATGTRKAAIQENFSKPGYRACDLRNPAAVRETMKAAAEYFGGRIDVLVNNAGMAKPEWTDGRTMEDWSVLDDFVAYMETNLTGAFVATQAVLPFMKRRETGKGILRRDDIQSETETEEPGAAVGGGGAEYFDYSIRPDSAGPCVINISSIHALQSDANCEGYAASKAGLLGLTHAIAVSGAQWGIRCNVILPGLIHRNHENEDGDVLGTTWAENVDKALHQKHPAGRVGSGEDIAQTVEWLMDAGFVTGQEIVVDGGSTRVKYGFG